MRECCDLFPSPLHHRLVNVQLQAGFLDNRQSLPATVKRRPSALVLVAFGAAYCCETGMRRGRRATALRQSPEIHAQPV
jgi:hypothetical protein